MTASIPHNPLPPRSLPRCVLFDQQCMDYNQKMVSEDKAERQDTAGLNILRELDGEARMAVVQDLAMYYIHQPRHPYVVGNPLCQKEEFTSWAADVSLANQLAIVQRTHLR
ncbi:unnamed protein product [Closterium sp. NIES-54]